MRLVVHIAFKHLLARRRQSLVSLMGIILGVAFFLAISSLMQGSENDFVKRLVDNSPHITISDEFREPRRQPVETFYENGAIDISGVKPVTETRGIRGFEKILDTIRTIKGLQASASLTGQVVVNVAGKDRALTANGMVASEMKGVTTIENYMIEGSVDDLIANPDGVVLGAELAKRLALNRGDNITVASPTGQVQVFKLLGIYRTGRSDYDNRQAFFVLKKMQSLFGRPNRANSIIVKLQDPFKAQEIAAQIENQIGYKCVSWQEASEDLLNTLAIRNTIMYTVVSAVLVVAAFGIYNVISTVVMEKHRDIAIMKSMGFRASDIKYIFLVQGAILGMVGNLIGLPLGCAIMAGLMQIKFKPPGSSEVIQMPIDWGSKQFMIAATFAMTAAIIAAFLPARKAAGVQPVEILRGSQ